MRIFVGVLLLLCIFGCAQAFSANGTSFSIKERSAYCYYYSSKSISASNSNTWINGTSNNLYGYLSVYNSNSAKLSLTSTNLAICTPNQGNHNDCTTEDISWTYSETVKQEYILVCMECHYWFGPCIFDSYYVQMSQSAEGGYVDCSFCN
mmetsp:Transcript_114872/g.171741  ORF Transcript_114872/g.171741 Transcript_114872/m.171741 type:complete len:150 (-) Transcript_114872:24-473(-)